MLSNELKKTIQTAYSTFLENRELKPRGGQKQMIAVVANTLASAGRQQGEGENLCLVEAGTGTGKTIAYLLAAVPIAQKQGKKVVVSTATVALQEQLVSKDLPQLIASAGINTRYMLAKGRGRYFCVSKAESHLEEQGQLGQMALYEDELARRIDDETVLWYKDLLTRFASGKWDGDRDSLPEAVDEESWQPLTSDHLQCTNRRCSNFSICPFFKARQQLDQVDLVVANHDLVLADLSLGGGAILPEPAETIYIFDEGHHLSNKTTGHFAYSLRVKGAQRWLTSSRKKLHQLVQDCAHQLVLADYAEKLMQPFQDMEQQLEQWLLFMEQLFQDRPAHGEARMRFAKGQLPDELVLVAKGFAVAGEKAVLKFEQIVDLLKEAMDGELADIPRDVAERWFPQIGVLWARMQGMYWLAKAYGTPDPEGGSPTARWISRLESGDGLDYECRSSPVSAAETLAEHLWQHCHGAVVTSATLTALGRFDRALADLGLPPQTSCRQLASPFDHHNAAELHIPAMNADPGDPDAHTEAVADYLLQTLPQNRATLVLFSSWRQMLTVLERMPESINNNVLAQGQLGKQEILSRHREKIDEGKSSIIFGLASFAEGVDLPGDYLTEVIITKLPFSVPDDPVDATMAEWIEARGGNAFAEWAVPMASMRLTQATGRLLRTEQDRGRIVLLDRRLISRRYGRQLLDALPPYRRNFA
ncbi:ATP-dependent DNA helicase DinG [Marinobacterium arenosum]|uniref:ATP-dependent DNA helicase DinG n=1 Tax=Marinobacterium arenosum TaxID=2862496 RepID=UPI001C945FCF|nr:ATP-dependent DNA helicase DinG [Marinobacterium arenosum]MBY4676935.1 ATP-dependent DNA helicase DinG [Marinobacterium arenosum]